MRITNKKQKQNKTKKQKKQKENRGHPDEQLQKEKKFSRFLTIPRLHIFLTPFFQRRLCGDNFLHGSLHRHRRTSVKIQPISEGRLPLRSTESPSAFRRQECVGTRVFHFRFGIRSQHRHAGAVQSQRKSEYGTDAAGGL